MKKKQKSELDYNGKIIPYLVLILTIIVFIRTIGFDFLSIDDELFVSSNPDIQSFTYNNLVKIFSSFYGGMYMPITMLTYTIEFAFFKTNPAIYHITNLLFHLINVFLVFFLFKKISQKPIIAILVTLLFAIHPMHVESVVWIAERKDVLYCFFYLLSIIFYFRYYYEEKKKKWIALSLLFFVLSVLSKSMAVTLPVLLILIDYYKKRRFEIKTLWKIAPFFAISIVFAFLSVLSQKEQGGLNALENFSIIERFIVFTYSASYYIVKMFFPINLSIYHFFPLSGNVPIIYYLSPLFIVLISVVIYKLKTNRQEIIFGMLMYFVSILPVLQIIPIGDSVVSERYSYFPSLGVFFIIGFIVNKWYEYLKNKKKSTITPVVFVLSITIVISLVTYNNLSFWKDSKSILTDLINKDSKHFYPYFLRGNTFLKEGKSNEAITDYNEAIAINPLFAKSYYHRGKAKSNINLLSESIMDFDEAEKVGYKEAELYNDRGNVKSMLQNYPTAINDYNKAISINSNFSESFVNRGNAYLYIKDYNNALYDYNKAVELGVLNAGLFYNRGVTRATLGDFAGSIFDFGKLIEINPNDAQAFFLRGYSYKNMNEMRKACDDWNTSYRMGNNTSFSLIQQYCK